MLDALGAPPDPGLRAALGAGRHDALRARILEHTLAWAQRAGDGAPPAHVRGRDELPPVLAGHDGPVLLVAPDVPGLSPRHLAAAHDDWDHGVVLSTGITGDATLFLMALARPEPRLLELAGAPLDAVVQAAGALGALGILRPERRLATLADARALRADPLADPELRALVEDVWT